MDPGVHKKKLDGSFDLLRPCGTDTHTYMHVYQYLFSYFSFNWTCISVAI